MGDRVVIAGAGHAAGQIVATLKQRKFTGEVLLLGEEPYLPYQRPPLSKKFLAGELPIERLYLKPESFYTGGNLQTRLNTRIGAIDRPNGRVLLFDGESIVYTKLVLAVGARARRLGLPGAGLPGIHYLRSIDDVLALRQELAPARRMIIVGAGYIGLEVAAVTCQLGLDVTVIEMAERVMSRVVSVPVSNFYAQEHRARGVRLLLSTAINGFTGKKRVSGVRLSNGEELPADVVLLGIGIEPNTELAADAGLDVDDGIVVDDHCRTADPDIYAVGDCTRHPSRLFGRSLRLESVHNALEQAKTAALNICGEDTVYDDVPWFWSDQYDIKLQIAGLSQGYDRTVLRGEPASRSFSCLYLRDRALIAVDAVNSPRDFMQSKALIAAHARIPPERLADNRIALKDMPC